MADADPSMGQHELEVGEQAAEKSQILKKQRHDDDLVAPAVAKPWPGWPGESVFRMLIPAHKAGIVIGKKGEFIRKMVEETRARIKILDAPPGSSERVVMVSAKEEPDSSVPPAIDGLLRVHKCVVGGVEGDNSHTPSGVAGKVSTRLLIAATQSGVVIGKQGGAVKSIMEASNCVVRVLGAEDLPGFALQDDRVVEVVGDPVGVHKAVELIASQLRKFLVDRSVMPLFEMQTRMQNSQIEHTRPPQSRGAAQGFSANGSPGLNSRPNSHYMPPSQHHDSDLWNASCQTRVQNSQIEHTRPPQSRGAAQGFSANGIAGPYSRPDSHYISPSQHHDGFYTRETASPWQHDSVYLSHDMDPPMDKHFHQGISTYGRNPPSVPSSSVITQVTQLMQIPLTYADAVIGTAGANVSYIRRTSGATVTIQESKAVFGEMAVEINGSAAQVQTAQQLIQNFMAEAASSAQTQVEGASDPVYASYASHSSMYSSPPSNTGHATHAAGGYGSGSVYGTAKYGY